MTPFAQARLYSIVSSCCGVTGEVVLTESAVIILYATMLGAGDMLTLLTTSVLPLCNGLLIIPAAALSMRTGAGKIIISACLIATLAYFGATAAPFANDAAVGVLIGSILIFAISLPGFIAGWFPLLDTFLLPKERTYFLGKMRFCHQLTAVLFLIAVSMLIKKNPSLQALQIVLFIGGIIFFGRVIFILKIPKFHSARKSDKLSWYIGLKIAMRNRDLTRFSIYQFALNLTAYGTLPSAMIYLKNDLHVPDNMIVFISGTALAGMLIGYLFTGKLTEYLTRNQVFGSIHFLFPLVNLGIFYISNATTLMLTLLSLLLATASFALASSSIVCSAEMMSLASPGNKTMAMAWSGAFFYVGAGMSRFLASVLLGVGLPCRMLFSLYATGSCLGCIVLIYFLHKSRPIKKLEILSVLPTNSKEKSCRLI